MGYLLFWTNATGDGTSSIGTNQKQKPARLLIVDGQQRMTSLYAVLKGHPVIRENYKSEKIMIAFKPVDQSFAVTDAAIKKDAEYIADISELWNAGKGRNRVVRDFLNRLKEKRPLNEAEEDYLSEAIDRLYDIQNFPFTALEISANVTEEEVADIFVRINSQGKSLNQTDFILTLMSVFWDQGRTDLENFCKESRQPNAGKASAFNHFLKPDPDELLRVSVGYGFKRGRMKAIYSVLRGKDMATDQFSDSLRDEQFEKLKEYQSEVLNLTNWHEFHKCLQLAGFRNENMISSRLAILYAYALFLIGRCEHKIDLAELRPIIAKWFFMCSITSRYTGSPETRFERDLNDFKDCKNAQEFLNAIENIISTELTDDFWSISLPNDLNTSSARSPSLYAYHAALNLLDAKALFSKMKVSELVDPSVRGNKAALEKHHLFPKKFLERKGISGQRKTNQIANFALVEWSDNIKISDDDPAAYFPKLIERYDQKERAQLYFWHALPDGWESMKYEVFLEKRRRAIAAVIREGFRSLSSSNKNEIERKVG